MAKAIKKVIPAILKPVLNKRGFAQAQIILDWEKIVGPQIVHYCVPERINYYKNAKSKGTLILSVTPGWAPIINHGKAQMIERINSYFGYEAVSRLQLEQTFYTQPQQSSQIESEEDTQADITRIEESIDLDNLNLKQALARLKHSLQSIR